MTTADWLRSLPALTGQAPPLGAGLPAEPHALFLAWLRQAVDAGVAEPHAATLATIDPDGLPDARTLILKDVDARGWAFAGRRSSRKGAQLAVHPVAALDFWWQPLVRAVRVRGAVREASPAESAADLTARFAVAREGIDDWVRWWIEPQRVEFWQGSPDRRHHRIVYLRTSDERGADRWIRSEERG
ncbi:pyridoxamine 5'-phosphate oxidase family protein [Microbacterium sp.]|uniref:pyridoxine/pyridoxamine 5'-phosphate oxidase n=1 Tax=Microbacterium sp. TaxID=51671 RepID=UPI0028119A74|nr:pyridoxamine 5'-phosphate oxidase family protein [Microbacterium sp.]